MYKIEVSRKVTGVVSGVEFQSTLPGGPEFVDIETKDTAEKKAAELRKLYPDYEFKVLEQ